MVESVLRCMHAWMIFDSVVICACKVTDSDKIYLLKKKRYSQLRRRRENNHECVLSCVMSSCCFKSCSENRYFEYWHSIVQMKPVSMQFLKSTERVVLSGCVPDLRGLLSQYFGRCKSVEKNKLKRSVILYKKIVSVGMSRSNASMD